MDRPLRLLRFALPLLIAQVGLPLAPRAAAYFNISPVATTASTKTIQLSVHVDDVYGNCQHGGLCTRTVSTIKITPCPPGDPCTDGTYQFNLRIEESRNLELPLGTSYSLEGSAYSEIGYTFLGDGCRYSCFNDQQIAPRVYWTGSTPSLTPAWDVSVVSSSLDTVYVDVRMLNISETDPCTSQPHCSVVWQDVRCRITPCPLGPTQCDGSIAEYMFGPQNSVRVALRNGTDYTLSGYYYVQTMRMGSHGFCDEPDCQYSERPPDKIFKASTVAVQPITWGAVKAMYRQP